MISLVLASVALAIPSSWNTTITDRGMPAYMDIKSPSYIPAAIRDLEFDSTLSKRASTPKKLQWAATFSDLKVKVDEYASNSGSCTSGCGVHHTFPTDLFVQAVDQLNSKCGEIGCNNGIEIYVAGKKVTMNVNAKYSSGKEKYVSAVKAMVANVSTNAIEQPYYRRHYSPRGGRCTSVTCSNHLVLTSSRSYSFALYYPKTSDPLSGGFHSNMDIEFEVADQIQQGSNVCSNIANVVATLIGVADGLFGAIASLTAPVICLPFS